jgi:hypothetical protein
MEQATTIHPLDTDSTSERDRLYPCSDFSAAKELEVHVLFLPTLIKGLEADRILKFPIAFFVTIIAYITQNMSS